MQQLDEEGFFVMAVRTPGTHDVDKDNLVLELRVSGADSLARFKVWRREAEGLARVFHFGERVSVGLRRNGRLTSHSGFAGRVLERGLLADAGKGRASGLARFDEAFEGSVGKDLAFYQQDMDTVEAGEGE